MSSLWLSFTAEPDLPGLHGPARRHLEGRLPPGLIADTLTVITGLVHHVVRHGAPGGELVVSRHDSALLVEVVTRGPRMPPAPARPGWTYGAHSAGAGSVTWAESMSRKPG